MIGGVSLELEINGNRTTHIMHFCTLHELHKIHLLGNRKLRKIKPEQTVLIDKNGAREGRFDFLVQDEEKRYLGIEILTRPTVGKMKNKLCYAKEVDEFIFVIPEGSQIADKYLNKKSKPFRLFWKPKELPCEFDDDKINFWFFDLKEKKFTRKGKARELFCIERKKKGKA